ncbi:MAG: elongation factor G [Clostridiales bacterium]|nr:elongation factor G [Clostridiales bacterium]
MKVYNAKDIRNIALAGHGGRGKTTLAEGMLFLAKATDRWGKVAEGNSNLDYDAEEKRRKSTVSLSVAPLEWQGKKLNLVDTPGLFDFAGSVSEGMRAVESALIVTAAGSDYDVGAEKAFRAARDRGLAKMFAVTRCDAEHTDFYKTYDAIVAEHESKVCPVVIPFMEGEEVVAYVDLSAGKAYSYKDGKATEVDMPSGGRLEELTEVFNEAIASADEELMEKYFEGEAFTAEEVAQGLANGLASGELYPVFACSGLNLDAVDLLLNHVTAIAPAAADHAGEKSVDGKDIACDEDGPLAAVCFKTIADPFVGKMSFFKVISGKITSDVPAYNARTGESERMGKIIAVLGSKQEDISQIPAGDIGVVTKLSGINTGDTLCSAKDVIELQKVKFPAPYLSMAVKVRKKGEEDKVAQGLTRLVEEDPTISYFNNAETREQILSGLGEQHLDVVSSKLKAKFGVEVDLQVPKVAYRETIRKTYEARGRHKKQSGGHGQFGDVYIRFEPVNPAEHEEEIDLIFEEEIVGGVVPRQYFPAVEKGLRESITKGVLAGYPMVNLKATLYFGSFHAVDSSEIAFKTAASLAYREGIPNASPTILEPVGTLKAYMPDDNLGDIMGDITKRRGRVLGMGPSEEPKVQELVAEVPMAEMGDFSTVLRSVTAGRGSFSLEFARYEEAPQATVEKIIEAAKLEEED